MVTNGEVMKGGENNAPKPTRASPRWYGTSCSNLAASDEGMQPGRPGRKDRITGRREEARQEDSGRRHFGRGRAPNTTPM